MAPCVSAVALLCWRGRDDAGALLSLVLLSGLLEGKRALSLVLLGLLEGVRAAWRARSTDTVRDEIGTLWGSGTCVGYVGEDRGSVCQSARRIARLRVCITCQASLKRTAGLLSIHSLLCLLMDTHTHSLSQHTHTHTPAHTPWQAGSLTGKTRCTPYSRPQNGPCHSRTGAQRWHGVD